LTLYGLKYCAVQQTTNKYIMSSNKTAIQQMILKLSLNMVLLK
jgi:hypothetical protein